MPTKKKIKKKQVKAGRPFKKKGMTVRDDLIEAGTELLKTISLENLSLRQVSAKAGVSHVACYHHFQNKNALLAAIAEKGFEKYFSDYRKELKKTQDNFLGKYKALGITYVRFIMKNQQFARIMFGGAGIDVKSNPKLAAVSRRTYKQLHEIIRMGQRIGAISPGNARNKTLASWAMIHGIAMLFLEGRIQTKDNKTEMEDLIHSVTEYAYLGMKN